MLNQTREKFWQRSLGLALPVALISAIMDRHLLETVFGLWENVPPARLLFFLSSAFLILGLARNSARLRGLTEARSAHAQSDHRHHHRPTSHTSPPHHHEREPSGKLFGTIVTTAARDTRPIPPRVSGGPAKFFLPASQ